MKKYRIYNKIATTVILIVVLIALGSCGNQLEQYPKDQFDKENFWTNEANAKIGLAGVYRGNIAYGTQVNPTDWWTYAGLVFFEHATDNAFDRRGKNANQNRLTNGTLLANNGVIDSYWQGSYIRIAISNDFLENIERVEMSETGKKRMIADVRFIRACQYFYLSQFWGAVPLVTKTLTPEEANVVTKTSKAEIINFIIKEFTEAAADLPRYKDIPASEFGRASKQAALAFLGRIYLAEKKYTEASTAYKQIIEFGDNIIDPNYASIFNTTNETSAENIFSVQYYEGLAGNALPQHALPAVKSGWHIGKPGNQL